MIERNAQPLLRKLARQYPVVTVTGPRQSGKTTLCRAAFPDKPWVNLEPMDVRDEARRDPRGFLGVYPQGAILDEVQHVPELLTYVQDEVDRRPKPGRFVLTGSQQLGVSHAVSESLAGRTAMLELLPPSFDELQRFPSPPADLMTTLWSGAYPRIFDARIEPARWHSDYVTTYVQRDVRSLTNVSDLSAFTAFVRLAATRTAQELNLLALGADAGVSQPTARAWLSVLEASFLCRRALPWHRNLRKQTVKRPKLYFLDTGLVCHLLGIQTAEQLRLHPLRGAVFETWVASEIVKARAHRGLPAVLAHYREPRAVEVDWVLETSNEIVLVEAKSGATLADDFFAGLAAVAKRMAGAPDGRRVTQTLVHGGQRSSRQAGVAVLAWNHIATGPWSGR